MTKPPFLFSPLDVLQNLASRMPPPPLWLQAELHNRLVLWLNHVLIQEPQAMERLKRQQGKLLQVRWAQVELVLQPTPAGLLALAPSGGAPDLQLSVTDPSLLGLAQTVVAGGKPPVEIQGDVQLAAEVAWLVDNVRWDLEEDLSRLLGDAVAHTVVTQVKNLLPFLQGVVAQAATRWGPHSTQAVS